MNDHMKEIQKLAEEKGYTVVRYDEFEQKSDEQVRKRHMFVFEETK